VGGIYMTSTLSFSLWYWKSFMQCSCRFKEKFRSSTKNSHALPIHSFPYYSRPLVSARIQFQRQNHEGKNVNAQNAQNSVLYGKCLSHLSHSTIQLPLKTGHLSANLTFLFYHFN
jgi:hypothetical protein